ncbi:hypothetical protein RRG08_001594 [Elysia crispata]|uniref:Uncharacterized protein n=1 Tax=Elysia crispata TaxID=231223 RepID=A0AAE1AKA5_9GAST|nr:hypothetical protein RRG08_001594 [Elysia crispata]
MRSQYLCAQSREKISLHFVDYGIRITEPETLSSVKSSVPSNLRFRNEPIELGSAPDECFERIYANPRSLPVITAGGRGPLHLGDYQESSITEEKMDET